MSEDTFKKELKMLCMEVDLNVSTVLINSPLGIIPLFHGETVYRYYLTKNKITDDELNREIELYEQEYNENKKDVVYKNGRN